MLNAGTDGIGYSRKLRPRTFQQWKATQRSDAWKLTAVLCASSDLEDSPKTLMIWTSAAQPLGDLSLRPDKRPELPFASSLISFSVPYLPYSFAFFCRS